MLIYTKISLARQFIIRICVMIQGRQNFSNQTSVSIYRFLLFDSYMHYYQYITLMYIKVFCARIVYKGNRKTGTGYKYKTVLLEGLRKFFIYRHIRKCFICYCNFFMIQIRNLFLICLKLLTYLLTLWNYLKLFPPNI